MIDDALRAECHERFAEMVASEGVKKFAMQVGVSARQVNRMLSDAQPNPLERCIVCLLASEPCCREKMLDFICGQFGGHFVREDSISDATVNAVRECAEAIAAISDGDVTDMDVKEVRQAISALSSLILSLKSRGSNHKDGYSGT